MSSGGQWQPPCGSLNWKGGSEYYRISDLGLLIKILSWLWNRAPALYSYVRILAGSCECVHPVLHGLYGLMRRLIFVSCKWCYGTMECWDATLYITARRNVLDNRSSTSSMDVPLRHVCTLWPNLFVIFMGTISLMQNWSAFSLMSSGLHLRFLPMM